MFVIKRSFLNPVPQQKNGTMASSWPFVSDGAQNVHVVTITARDWCSGEGQRPGQQS